MSAYNSDDPPAYDELDNHPSYNKFYNENLREKFPAMAEYYCDNILDPESLTNYFCGKSKNKNRKYCRNCRRKNLIEKYPEVETAHYYCSSVLDENSDTNYFCGNLKKEGFKHCDLCLKKKSIIKSYLQCSGCDWNIRDDVLINFDKHLPGCQSIRDNYKNNKKCTIM